MFKFWVGAVFAVHPYMEFHTGAIVSLDKLFVYSTAICHKLDTKISNEAELVGVADVIAMVLWRIYFLES